MDRQKASQIFSHEFMQQKLKFRNGQETTVVCHRCLTSLNNYSRWKRCNDKYASLNLGKNLLTDPYMYNRKIINENCWDKDTDEYIHPYLIYYAADHAGKTAVCNRYFCNKCEGMEPFLCTKGTCNYCEGLCDCSRCQGMDLLTRMMAVYIDKGGELKHIKNRFLMKF